MSISDLLCQLSDVGVRVCVTREGLRVTNASSLTDELRRNLRGHRDQLLEELSLPLTDYALSLFGGAELNAKGRPIKPEHKDGGLL